MNHIRKTSTEIKQERLMRKHLKSRVKPKPKNKFESKDYLKRLTYFQFLGTKYWHHVKKLVLKRDDFKCVICKSNEQLQVHHDSYKNHPDELNHLEDLMTLCKSCHKEHHMAQ